MAVLVKKNTIKQFGIANENNVVIPFDNIQLIGGNDSEINQIATLPEVFGALAAISNSPYVTNYTLIDEVSDVLPSIATLNNLYDTTGIFVERLSDQTGVLLKRTPVANQPIPEVSVIDGEAIAILLSKTGETSIAYFTQKWYINGANASTAQRLSALETQTTTLSSELATTNTNLANLQGSVLQTKAGYINSIDDIYNKADLDNRADIVNNILVGLQGLAGQADAKADDNSTAIAANTASITANATAIAANTAAIATNTTNISTNKTTAETALTAGNDWLATKGGVALVSDITGAINNTANIAFVESGNDVIATLTPAAVNGFTNGALTVFKMVRDNVSPARVNDPSDYYNDNSVKANSLTLEGASYAVNITSTPTQLTISGLAAPQRAIVVGNYRLVLVSQGASQAGGSIDQTARNDAAAAQAKANGADAKADTNLASIGAINAALGTNTTQIGTNTTDIATNKANINANTIAIQTVKATADAAQPRTMANGTTVEAAITNLTTSMAQAATKAEVNTKAPQATTYTKAEVDAAIASAINALPKTPTRKDITATYATRVWNANDSGKKVWITASRNGIKVGFISEGADTTFSSGGAVVDLGISYTNTDKQFRLYWSTEHVSNVGNIVLHTDSKIEIFETAYHITKFEIEE